MAPEERKQEKREYSKAYYYLCKDHDVCPFCGKKSTKGMGVLCPECKESNRKSKQKWYESLSPERKKQEIQKNALREKTKHDTWRAAGFCTHCGGIRENESFMMCEKCREYFRKASVKKRKKGEKLCKQ